MPSPGDELVWVKMGSWDLVGRVCQTPTIDTNVRDAFVVIASYFSHVAHASVTSRETLKP